MATNQQPAEKKKATWEDDVADATPKQSQYYSALRTAAYEAQDAVRSYIEFMVAFKADQRGDRWLVMRYQVYDLDKADGNFVSIPVTKGTVPFLEALDHLRRTEYLYKNMLATKVEDMAEKYPAEKHPELRLHYHEIPHYAKPSHIEGLYFDDNGDIRRSVKGMIFAEATFKRSQIAAAINDSQSNDLSSARSLMEEGLLSEIFFSSASPKNATLDNVIKMGKCLSEMDKFAVEIGAFYLTIQKALGLKASFDLVEGLDADNRTKVMALAAKSAGSDFDDAAELLENAQEMLSEVEELGVYAEPFSKFVAECVVYTHMLKASVLLPKLYSGINTVSNNDISVITEIQESVEQAQRAFMRIGGSQEKMDRLKAWIANPEKDKIPSWMPGFLTRYYTSRGKVMEQINARRANMRDVSLLPADVKPPIQQDQQSPADEAAAAAAKKAAGKQAKANPQI